ncbi:folate-binding protein [Geminicoccaceae bacterium 1502E]|nr:folate-binding protein [Geminicoccaceae bacterium 1502E]
MTGVSYSRLESRALLRLSGPEARGFLQGLVTNDLDRLGPDRSLHAALLSPQGKFLFEFVLYEDSEAVLLEGEAGRRDELLRRLMLYRLRAKVQIEPDPRVVLGVPGRQGLERLALPAEAGACRRDGEALLSTDPRLAELGARVILAEHDVAEFVAAKGLEADADAWELHRLALGVPDGSRDLVVDRSTALEGNMEALLGVAFDKGCFVGQEVTARTKHRGLLKRRLVPVRVEGPLPAPGTQVTAGERDAGEVRSGHGDRAICLLRLDFLAVDGPTLKAGDSIIVPQPPAWMEA